MGLLRHLWVVFAAALFLGAVQPSAGLAHSASVTVRPGDTLAGIAARVGSTPQALARLNGLPDPDHVIAGARLRTAGHAASTGSGSLGAVHVVRAGETLGSIAARRGITVAALSRANGISNPNVIAAGTRLRVSTASPVAVAAVTSGTSQAAYTVRAGDTLASIAARLGTSTAALARANGVENPNLIVVGTTLRGSASSRQPAAQGYQPSRAQVAVLLDQAAARHGVNRSLVRAVAWQESGWTQHAISAVGALGVMQLMPDTAAWAGPALLGRSIDPHAVEDNIDAGVAFLAHLVRATGDVPTALAGYNQGLASVQRRGLFNETKQYVASVQALVGNV